jgi:class 3 adenylate cyclase/HAMP domain-containing protein
LRLSRTQIAYSSGIDFSHDARFTETVARGVSYAPAAFAGDRPSMSISVAHSGFNNGITVADIDPRFLSDFLGDAQVGKATSAYVVDPHGKALATSAKGPDIGRDLSTLPQVAALIAPDGTPLASGSDVDGNSVLTASSSLPKLGWVVYFEQPTAQALAPIRDQLMRLVLLLGLGLIVAIAAGIVLARRMLVPITALRTGARKLGAGDFSHRIDVNTKDELEELAGQFNSMAGQLQETYSGRETKVEERTRDLARSINELKVLEEVGRAVASSLDLDAVLPTVAARALEITHADAVLIYGHDAARRQFALVEASGIDKSAEGAHLVVDEGANILSEAAANFTAFTEATEPEEAMNVVREYHAALGELIFKYEGTLDRYAGDGVMILFNAPIQFDDHTKRAVKMAVEMREVVGQLTQKWRNRGHSLGFGIGIALGYATLGQVGFEHRLEYAAIGSVTNLASRLCAEAKAGQIVVSRRVYGMVEQWVDAAPMDDLQLKGFNHPVLAMEILRWREEVDNVVDATAATAARRRK